MLPLALGLVIGSGASNRLSGLVGRTRVIAGGLVGVAVALSTSLAWTPDTAPLLLGLVTFGLAVSMGAAMAPATESVMSAVPEAKAGVGSGDERRHPPGRWRARRRGHRFDHLPARSPRDMGDAPHAATESIGAAHAIAARMGGEQGRELADTAAIVHRRARHRADRGRRRRTGRGAARPAPAPGRQGGGADARAGAVAA